MNLMKFVILASAAFMISFHAYGDDSGGSNCGDDCGRRAAGYEWAQGRNITDKEMCPEGDSEAFYEGCVAYTKEANSGQPAGGEKASQDAPK